MKISIIIPNYNYEKFISRTIESIIMQDYPNIEIIIVDDGSSDNSFDIISKYLAKYPDKIKAIKQQNMGQANAINTGLRQAEGEIIGWINSDDTYCKNSLDKVMNVFEHYPDIDIVYGNINIINTNDEYISSLKHYKFSYFMSVFTGFANNLSSNAVFWRKDLMIRNGYLNADFKCGLDNEFFSRITWKSRLYHLNTPIANFRKQEITKAAIGHSDWNALMKRESNYVFEYSYNKLKISKFIPFKIATFIRPLILTYKRILRILSGNY